MRKFLLVVLIMEALVMAIYGFVKPFVCEEIEEIDHISETTTLVYME